MVSKVLIYNFCMKSYLSLSLKKFLAVTTIATFFFSNSAFAAIAVNNGNFSDTSGMTNAGGGWYHGNPNSWSANGTNQYVINNNVLNLDHVGTFTQSLGTVDLGGEDITVSFEYGDIFSGGYYAPNEDMITVELRDTTANTTLATKTVKNTGAYGIFVSDTISTITPATVGNTLEVRFTSLPGTGITPGSAAAIDNVSVLATDSTAPIITNISSSVSDGSYNETDAIDIDVSFSEAVTSANVILTLDTGGTCTFPVTNSATGTCNYIVWPGENSSDLTVTTITGTIQDATLNTLTNFTPLANLAANKNIIIDTTAPTVPTNTLPNGTFVNTDSFDLTWDVSTDNQPGAVTYEYQASQDPAVDGFGVLTTGVWSSGLLATNMINSTGASQGIWYWQVRAKDVAGNYSAWSPVSNVTKDTIAPVISADDSFLTVGPVTATGAIITYSTVPSAIDVGTPSPLVTCLPASGTNFSLNSTATITCNSTDNAWNTGVQTFNIFIQDVEDPVLLLPGDITIESVAPASAVSTFTVSATDNVDTFWAPVTSGSAPAIVCSHLSGDTFNFGTTLVTCTATDSEGNDTTDDFNVIVKDTIAPTVVITLDDTVLNIGDTALVTFTFSEVPVGFDNADVTVENGTIDAITGSGTVYTATLTPTAGVEDTTNKITVGTDWSDANTPTGNAPAGATDSPNYEMDTLAPVQSSVVVTPLNGSVSVSLTTHENATVTLSYGFTNAYGSSANITTVAASTHDKTVLGLAPCSVYHYSVVSTDTHGNISSSTDSQFTSLGVGSCTGSDGGGQWGSPGAGSITEWPSDNTQSTNTSNNQSSPAPTSQNPNNASTTPESNPVSQPTQTPNTTPTPESTPVAPNEATPENPSTPTDNSSTPETTPESTPTSTPTGDSNSTGNNAAGAEGQGFNPADATLDQGGGTTPDETEVVTEATPETTTDIGGWNAVEESNSYTLLWTLLGLIALLNTWWFFVAKGSTIIPPRN
jgi:hypothetical protein